MTAHRPIKDSAAVTRWKHIDGKLHPASTAAARMVDKWANGKHVTIDVREDRHAKFHRFFFAFLGLVTEAINSGPLTVMTNEQLLKWLKLKLGYVKIVELPDTLAKAADQSHAIEYQSISFARMDDAAFHAFATQCAELVGNDLATYIASTPQWAEVRSMIDQLAPEVAA